ncbi:MAG: toprim domain-containing protein [Thermoplasmata archaeon]|nr:toprim domain-containing protein [Thermoplasmata archaeon]
MGTRGSRSGSSRPRAVASDPPAWEAFDRAWSELRRALAEPGAVLLVEGENDRRSVQALGIPGRVHLVHHGDRMPEVAERVSRSASRVIVLTDWDAAGGRLARRLADLLRDGRVDVDLEHRRRLGVSLRGELVHVEGLLAWVERRLAETNRTVDEWRREADGAPALPESPGRSSPR